jgi:uncharacterized low-complexity protein
MAFFLGVGPNPYYCSAHARMAEKDNANLAVKESRQARVREDSQANKAREGFCGWQVHHHF